MGEQFPDKTSISFFRLSRLSRLSHKKKVNVFQFVRQKTMGQGTGQTGTGFCPTNHNQNK